METIGLQTKDYYFDLPQEQIAQDPLDDRSSSIRDVRENKNYFAEAYKVTTGITYFSKAIPSIGI